MDVGDLGLVPAANVLIGSIPGVLLGSRLAVQVPEGVLRGPVAVVPMAVGLKLP